MCDRGHSCKTFQVYFLTRTNFPLLRLLRTYPSNPISRFTLQCSPAPLPEMMCTVSLKVALSLTSIFLVGCSVGIVWYPVAKLCTDALVTARGDQMMSQTIATAQHVLMYFSRASHFGKTLRVMYETSSAKDPNKTMALFAATYSEAIWLGLQDDPNIASTRLVVARNPSQVLAQAAEGNAMCDADAFVLSPTYHIVAVHETRSLPNRSVCDGTSIYSCKPGFHRMYNIEGHGNKSHPLAVKSTKFERTCASWNGDIKGKILPVELSNADPENLDTGLLEPVWQQIISVVGKAPNQALYRKLTFPIPGPPWAPNSGFGIVAIRAGESSINTGTQSKSETGTDESLSEMLRNIAGTTGLDDLLVLISGRGELIATSSGIPREVQDFAGHTVLGLTAADNKTRVPDPVLSVASKILSDHCIPLVSGFYDCNWKSLPVEKRLQVIGENRVAFQDLDDPNAQGMNMLFFTIVKESTIVKPASDLNKLLAIILPSVILVFFVLSYLASIVLAAPIKRFTKNIKKVAALQFDGKTQGSVIYEVASMNRALDDLTERFLFYRSFIPQEAYVSGTSDSGESSMTLEFPSGSSAVSIGQLSANSAASPGKNAMAKNDRLSDIVREKNAIVLAINMRGWTARTIAAGAAKFVLSQLEHIEFLSHSSAGGSIIFVNGDRSLIAFTKTVSLVAERITASLMELMHKPIPCMEGTTAVLFGGSVYAGLVGTNAYRCTNVYGDIISAAMKLSDVAGKTRTEQVVILCGGSTAYLANHVELLFAGVLTVPSLAMVRGNSGVYEFFEAIEEKASSNEEWMYALDTKKKDVVTVFNETVQLALGMIEAETLASYAEAVLILEKTFPHLPCINHLRAATASSEEFMKRYNLSA